MQHVRGCKLASRRCRLTLTAPGRVRELMLELLQRLHTNDSQLQLPSQRKKTASEVMTMTTTR